MNASRLKRGTRLTRHGFFTSASHSSVMNNLCLKERFQKGRIKGIFAPCHEEFIAIRRDPITAFPNYIGSFRAALDEEIARRRSSRAAVSARRAEREADTSRSRRECIAVIYKFGARVGA